MLCITVLKFFTSLVSSIISFSWLVPPPNSLSLFQIMHQQNLPSSHHWLLFLHFQILLFYSSWKALALGFRIHIYIFWHLLVPLDRSHMCLLFLSCYIFYYLSKCYVQVLHLIACSVTLMDIYSEFALALSFNMHDQWGLGFHFFFKYFYSFHIIWK